jgi:hypothetical protein
MFSEQFKQKLGNLKEEKSKTGNAFVNGRKKLRDFCNCTPEVPKGGST